MRTCIQVWEELNCVFDRLPLAAVIDRDIFCIHGGIPRPLPNSPDGASRLDMIAKIPAVQPKVFVLFFCAFRRQLQKKNFLTFCEDATANT